MSGIICAIRGGPHSQPTIRRAISLAKETGLQLNFLYIVNLEFLSHTISSRSHTISEEMHQMGEFLLLTAQATAAAQGVEAQGVVRHGKVREEMIRLCHEMNTDYLVLGRPRIEREDNLFTHEMLNRFIERTEQETGAKVILSEDESP
jgi:nucleotide-binding universal stress UspA family protein